MFLVMITQVVPQTKIVPAIAYMFLHQTILLILITCATLAMDRVQVYIVKTREKYSQDDNEQKPLYSVNEEQQSLLEEVDPKISE